MEASVSPGFVAGLAALTVGWCLAIDQVVRMWHHSTSFFDVDRTPKLRYRRARVRAIPAGVLTGLPFLIAAWILAFDKPKHAVNPDAGQLVALACAVLVAIGIFAVVPAIVLFNRPRRLVPPHLRDQPGYLDERRYHTG